MAKPAAKKRNAHLRKRFAERLGMTYRKGQHAAMVSQIDSGLAECRALANSKGREQWVVQIDGESVVALYEPKRRRVISVLGFAQQKP